MLKNAQNQNMPPGDLDGLRPQLLHTEDRAARVRKQEERRIMRDNSKTMALSACAMSISDYHA